MALRGTRSKHFTVSRPISEVSFGLIPSEPAYETWFKFNVWIRVGLDFSTKFFQIYNGEGIPL